MESKKCPGVSKEYEIIQKMIEEAIKPLKDEIEELKKHKMAHDLLFHSDKTSGPVEA